MAKKKTKKDDDLEQPKKGNRGSNYFQRRSAYFDAVKKTMDACKFYPEFNDTSIVKKVMEVEKIISKYLGSNIYKNARPNRGKDMFWAIKSGTGMAGLLPKESRQKMIQELKHYGTIAGWPMTGKYNQNQDVLVHVPLNNNMGGQ